MTSVTIWKNVAVAMESAKAGAKTITGITKASPGVVTSTAHGYSNGDILLLSIQGMYQLDNKVVRVASVATDTFQLEGIDTTNFDTFTSGSAYKITLGTSVTSATNITSGGGNFDMIDTTTIHVNAKTQSPGLPNPTTFSMDHLWDPTDAGQIALKAASDIQAMKCFKFTFGSGGKVMLFAGYVGFSGLPGGSAQDKITTPSVITMYGTPTYFAS